VPSTRRTTSRADCADCTDCTDSKPVIPRAEAARDVDETVDCYLLEEPERAALGFIKALANAYLHIDRHPASGSPGHAHELNLPSLGSWPLTRYPQIVFYVEGSDHIDVWCVLDGKCDVPQWVSQWVSKPCGGLREP